jgi:light-regulated signal transduction histidine kinase (bacteriophytochrome)
MQRTEDEIKYLDFISKGADEMSQLIDALLSFSKLNRKELRKTTIHSVAMVEQVVRFFESETKNRNIRVIIGSLEDCKGDEQLIKQVWTNLVSNAIKYTGKKPEAIIEIGCTRGEHELVYFVKDNGDGFDMKNAGKLFGVFRRLHKNSDFEGVGIGLANVKNIITRHGGHCTAEGEKGKGARFSFGLPN